MAHEYDFIALFFRVAESRHATQMCAKFRSFPCHHQKASSRLGAHGENQ